MKRSLLSLTLLAALGGGSYYAWSAYQETQSAETATVSYQTTTVAKGVVEQLVSGAGQVAAVDQVEISALVAGQVTEIPVTFNDRVQQGDLLAQIDPRTFEARVAQTSADVKSAEASIAYQQTQIELQQLALTQAEREQKRLDSLAAGLASDEARELAAHNVAQARVRIRASQAQLKSATAQLEKSQAALKQAQVELEHTTIVSPIDGMVLSRDIEPGQIVSVSSNAPLLFTLARDLSQLEIIANIDESDIGTLREELPVSFTVDAYPERQFSGQISQIRRAAENSQGVVTYPVVIEARNPQQLLMPGMTADLSIQVARQEESLRVANSALRYGARQPLSPLPGESAGKTGDKQGAKGDKRGGGRQSPWASLDLSEQQQEQLRQRMAKLRGQSSSGGPLAGNSGGPRKPMSPEAINKILQSVLSDEQWQAYQQQQKQKAGQAAQRGQLTLLLENGQTKTVSVRLGISDGTWTVIESDRIQGQQLAGATVITRAIQ